MKHRRALSLWMRALLAVAVAVAWLATPRAAGIADVGDVAYVSATDPTCAGHKPCFTNLRLAVGSAPVLGTLRVAAGTYTDPETASRGYLVWIYKTLVLEGGWNLTFTERDPVAYPTVLDAQGLGRVVRIYHPSPGIRPVIDGFVIQGGNATGRFEGCGSSGDCGGGIYSVNASPIIANNVIAGNVATTNPNTWGLGGGVYLWNQSAPATAALVSNTIENNVANQAPNGLDGHGGGVYVDRMTRVQFVDNGVLGNTADRGGGIYLTESSGSSFSGNDISQNHALEAGGVYLWYSDGSSFLGNTVSGNDAAGLLLMYSSPAHLEGNTLQGNGGSGAKAEGGDVTAINNVITGNGASYTGGDGALTVGAPALIEGNIVSGNSQGGIRVRSWEGVSAVMRNNTIADNQGIGLYLEGPGTIQDNLIARNTSGGNAGGIQVWVGLGTVIEGNTIDDNQAAWNGGGIHIQNCNKMVISHNLFRGNEAGAGGGLFVMGTYDGTVRNNVFSGNKAGAGGGVYASGSHFTAFSENILSQNMADSGGGLYLYQSGPLTANDILDNQATNGGGIWSYNNTFLAWNNIAGNVALERGGGLYQERGLSDLRHNLIARNQATTGAGGYIDTVFDSNGILEGNRVLGNVASGDGGGWFLSFPGTLSLTNNVLAGNSAGGHGDQLYIYAGWWPSLTATLRHNTFAHHALGGEALFVGDYTTLSMVNTMVVSHTVGIVEGGVDSSVQADHTFFAFNVLNYPGVTTSHVMTGTYRITSTNEITGNPGFADVRHGAYHLTAESDAIDAGVDAGLYTDIDGGPRPNGWGFDIGADEWWLRVQLPCIVR
jgi:fibronectin-binding autotransporter adhesin